jgi:peptidoglycan-associated lipoprotein
MMNQKQTIARISAVALAFTLSACQSTSSTTGDGASTADVAPTSNDATAVGVGASGGLSSETVEEGEVGDSIGGDVGAGMDASDAAAALQTVFYFDFDNATLSAEVRDALSAQAARLAPLTTPVVLHGHADERGTREYNMALGERRAKAVESFLKLNGVAASRIEVISFGEEKPVAEVSSESAWSQNRRVELK